MISSSIKAMKHWIQSLKKALGRHFYEDEIDNIVSYYEEIISERQDQGELIDDILMDYDIDEIVRLMTPNVLIKRSHTTGRSIGKSTLTLLLLLLSTPFLIPIGVLYLVFLIVAFVMIVVVFAVIVSSAMGLIGLFVELIQGTLGVAEVIGLTGVALMMTAAVIMLSLAVYRILINTIRLAISFFSRLAKRKGAST